MRDGASHHDGTQRDFALYTEARIKKVFLPDDEIARAFLVTPAVLTQRMVRAKAVIRDKAIPCQSPGIYRPG